jgi:hypothetical protein
MAMIIVKNSPGVSYAMSSKTANRELLGTYSGSSLSRKKIVKTQQTKAALKNKELKKENVLSPRSKAKIRLKIYALSGVLFELTFVTLTFVNEVEDRKAIEVLKCFLENAKKRNRSFEYIWVAEKQTRNKLFPNNIHFHLVTNIYWDIKRWWQYWIDVQAKFGIVPRENQKAGSSAFDVKKINSNNKKAIGNYIAGYLSKSQETFDCRVWHCSRRISSLYTGFYSGIEFIQHLEALDKAQSLGGSIKIIPKEFCNIILVPINSITEKLYEKIHIKNRVLWFSKN